MTDRIRKALGDLKARQGAGEHIPCPRCGRDTIKENIHTNALSRHADIYICDACGMVEALLKFIAIGWFANTDWLGTIHDDSIRGLRLRKGNIQIGDDRTLNGIFSQARFNGWNQGEIFVLNNELIPNARRDNFEQNNAYHRLMRSLKDGIGSELSTAIGKASRERNDPAKKVVGEALKAVDEGQSALMEGFASGVSKQRIVDTLSRSLDAAREVAERKPRPGD